MNDVEAHRLGKFVELDLIPAGAGVLPAGARVGRCVIEAILGRGGMAVVYRARDEELGRRVALKVLHLQAPLPAGFVERFTREARAAARLQHPNIVRLYDAGESDGLRWLAMELIDGEGLDALLPGELRDRVALVEKTARALDAAHREGVVHRDVKPANILVDRAGEPHVADFGLARVGDEPAMTRSHAIFGTPTHMSPEQVRGHQRAIDARTDIYSLGVILYEQMAGTAPFQAASTADLFSKILREEPATPAGPAPLAAICLKAMAKEPAARYPTAAAFADDLKRWLAGEPVQARRMLRLGALWRPVAIAALVLVVIATVVWRQKEQAAIREYEVRLGASSEAWLRYREASANPEVTPARLAELRQDAERAARRAAEAGPDRAQPVAALAECLNEGGDTAGAVASWEEALRRDPRSFDALAGLAREAFVAYFSRRQYVTSAGKSVATAETADLAPLRERWQSLLLRARAAVGDEAKLRLLDALDALAADRITDAVRGFDAYVQQVPGDPQARYLRGIAHRQAGEVEFAERDITAALNLASRRPVVGAERVEWLLARAGLRLGLGRTQEALADADAAVAEDGRYWAAWLNRGAMRLALNQNEEALADLTKAIELNPDALVAYQNRGIALRRLRRYEEAIADLELAARRQESAAALVNLGNAYREAKRGADALKVLDRAIELDGELPQARLARALVHVDLSSTGDRRLHLEAALADLEKAGAEPAAAALAEQVRRALQK